MNSMYLAAAHECGHALIAALQGRGGRVIVGLKGAGMCNTFLLMATWSEEKSDFYRLGGAAGEIIYDHTRCKAMGQLDVFLENGAAADHAAKRFLTSTPSAFHDLTGTDPSGNRDAVSAVYKLAAQKYASAFAKVMAIMLPHAATLNAMTKAVAKHPYKSEGVWFHPDIAHGDIQFFETAMGVKRYATQSLAA